MFRLIVVSDANNSQQTQALELIKKNIKKFKSNDISFNIICVRKAQLKDIEPVLVKHKINKLPAMVAPSRDIIEKGDILKVLKDLLEYKEQPAPPPAKRPQRVAFDDSKMSVDDYQRRLIEDDDQDLDEKDNVEREISAKQAEWERSRKDRKDHEHEHEQKQQQQPPQQAPQRKDPERVSVRPRADVPRDVEDQVADADDERIMQRFDFTDI